jgi:hypothetical protein
LSDWIESCAAHYAAAIIYQSLARLSDSELQRLGLSRETLAHDLVRARERKYRRSRRSEVRR